MRPDVRAEWLEADGLGGFASGTAGLLRTRRYHAHLLAATPTGRFVLVNGLDVEVTRTERHPEREALDMHLGEKGVSPTYAIGRLR